MKQPLSGIFPALILCVAAGHAQTVTASITNNDVIEMSRAGVPTGTIITAIQNGQVKFDVSPTGIIALHSGGVQEAVINQMIRAGSTPKAPAGPAFGVATGTFPVRDALGKNVRFSAWIKTENVMNGYAGLWWRVDGPEQGKALAFDNSQARFVNGVGAEGNGTVRGAMGTTGWTKYEFEIPVAPEARNINFGAILTGSGTAWFDALSIELDDTAYINPTLFDLDFESTMARGFYTGGAGYSVGVDNTAAYKGKQSLRMRYIADSNQSK